MTADTSVEVLVPALGRMPLADLQQRIVDAPRHEPYGDEILALCAEFSKRLGRAARGMPELQALAFWMRRAELVRLRDQFAALASDNLRLVPRGVVLHVPPANVDTIFVYSWLLSALAGNVNVVRLSSRQTPQTTLIREVLTEVLAEAPESLSHSTIMVSYGHEQEITTALSQLCDVRVIWGGDRTVNAVRQSPLPVHATELTFPDRFSMSALGTRAWLEADEATRAMQIEKFFNDSYWFDQLGCSSPRLVTWVGGTDAEAQEAADTFFTDLRAMVQAKSYEVEAATAIAKMTFSYGSALDHDLAGRQVWGNEVTVLELDRFDDVRGEFCGAGLFWSLHVAELAELAPQVRRADQTLSHFGIGRDALLAFAASVNGRGIDRVVPFGEALTFNRFWDGHDLLQAFLRRVWVDAD